MIVRPATDYRRIGLGLLLLAAAAPYRYYGSFPLVASVSVLDAALFLAGIGLLARRVVLGRIELGDHRLFGLLCVLPVLSLTSLLWTVDTVETVREVLSYGECVLAYAYVVQQTSGVRPERIIAWTRRFTYALLLPCFFLLLHVPGFAPQAPGIKHSAGDYLSFFSRLSHPFIGRSNNLATILLMLVVVLVYWAVTRHDVATYVAAAVATIALVLTFSRGALLALVIAALVWLVRRTPGGSTARRRLATTVRSVLAAAVAAGWAFYVLNPDTREFIVGRLSLSNLFLRESRLSHGFDWLANRPLLGYGAGTLPGNDAAIAGGVHNTFLQQLLAYGVVLGVVGVIALLEVTRYFLGGRASGLRRAIGVGMVALLIDFSVEASFEGQALRVIVYVLIGMAAGLLRATEAAVPSAVSGPSRTAAKAAVPSA